MSATGAIPCCASAFVALSLAAAPYHATAIQRIHLSHYEGSRISMACEYAIEVYGPDADALPRIVDESNIQRRGEDRVAELFGRNPSEKFVEREGVPEDIPRHERPVRGHADVVGTVELLSIMADRLGLSDGPWSWVANLDLNTVGFAIVALVVCTWAAALAVWRFGRIEERWTAGLQSAPSSGPQ